MSLFPSEPFRTLTLPLVPEAGPCAPCGVRGCFDFAFLFCSLCVLMMFTTEIMATQYMASHAPVVLVS